MDIYSAEAQVKKLLEYVTSLSESQSKMYKKTKVRLNDLASTCSQVVEVISRILQERALEENDSDSEFGGHADVDIMGALANMQMQIDTLHRFVLPPKDEFEHSEISTKSDLTSAVRKRVFSDYKSALRGCAVSASPYPAVVELSDVLWTWFRARFVNSLNVDSGFRYNIRRWPEWIKDIVVMYGYSIDNNSTTEFVQEFKSWCNELSFSTANAKYAVPFNIYQFDKHPESDKLSVTAVILWDMLLDSGLSKISAETKGSDLYPSASAIYDMCEQLAPEVLDSYRHYKTDASIDRRFKILRADEVMK